MPHGGPHDGMMRIWTYVNTPTSFTFMIQILDTGIWDILPEHWTFTPMGETIPEVMTLDNVWNNSPGGGSATDSGGGWPVVVDSSNVGGMFYVRWDKEADGWLNLDSALSRYWTFCSGVVRLGNPSGGP